jgi:hypothetical protein
MENREELFKELYDNKLGLTMREIALISAFITIPDHTTIKERFSSNSDSSITHIFNDLIDKGVIEVDTDGNMTGINLTLPEEKVQWEFMRVNNVGFYSAIIGNDRWNAFYNDSNNWEAVNTTSLGNEVVIGTHCRYDLINLIIESRRVLDTRNSCLTGSISS